MFWHMNQLGFLLFRHLEKVKKMDPQKNDGFFDGKMSQIMSNHLKQSQENHHHGDATHYQILELITLPNSPVQQWSDYHPYQKVSEIESRGILEERVEMFQNPTVYTWFDAM